MTTHRRVGLPPGFNVAGAIRHVFWRQAFHLVGGFTVSGSAPYEAMVVVANHSSHADTPALIGAFPAPYKPVVVAADDYWFTSWWKRTGLSLAIGAVPVKRTGGSGFTTLMDGAHQVLGAGSSLLVFPEGTRTFDGEVGPFRTGALRLAKEFDVPVLPVALVGTFELLPKAGRLHPGPVEVRVGQVIQPEDIDVDDPSPMRNQILAMLDEGPARASTSSSWKAANRFMTGSGAMIVAALWGFVEAISWPIAGEVYLAAVGAANPRRLPHAAGWLALGSTAGVLVNAAATRAGHRPPAPLTTASMTKTAAAQLKVGARGIWRQVFSTVPVRVYAAQAGLARTPLANLAGHTLASRGVRAAATTAVVGVAALRSRRLLRRSYGPYLALVAAGYAYGVWRAQRQGR